MWRKVRIALGQSCLRSGLRQGLLSLLRMSGYQAHKITEFPCLHSSHLTISTVSTGVHYHTQLHTREGAEPRSLHLHGKCLSQGLMSAALRVVMNAGVWEEVRKRGWGGWEMAQW